MTAFWLAHPTFAYVYHLSIVQGAITGFITAFMVDVHAFLSWKSVQDATTWSFKVAAFRWAQGIVYGLTGGGVMGGLLG